LLISEEQQSVINFPSSKTNNFLFPFSQCFPKKPQWLGVANNSSKFKPLLGATSPKEYRTCIYIEHCYLQNNHTRVRDYQYPVLDFERTLQIPFSFLLKFSIIHAVVFETIL
jgi:hypothetical protein